MRLDVHRLDMAHPGDVSALEALLDRGALSAANVVAVIGKTEGNGGVNDFTRGYFTQSLMQLLAARTGRNASELKASIPCVLSGGTEGVLSPHYTVFSRSAAVREGGESAEALGIGTAMGAPVASSLLGGWEHVRAIAGTVRAAMRDARIERADQVVFVQVKCPFASSTRAGTDASNGIAAQVADPGKSMAQVRAAGAFGVALALGALPDDPRLADALLHDFSIACDRASVSSGVEVEVDEVIVLGHSDAWAGNLRMGCAPMSDALDIGAVGTALARLGIVASPQVDAAASERIVAAFVKCEPDRNRMVRGARHTMLDDTDINAQRHIRGAVGGLVAGVLASTRIFVSGGAEHQGPDGGGLVAIIGRVA